MEESNTNDSDDDVSIADAAELRDRLDNLATATDGVRDDLNEAAGAIRVGMTEGDAGTNSVRDSISYLQNAVNQLEAESDRQMEALDLLDRIKDHVRHHHEVIEDLAVEAESLDRAGEAPVSETTDVRLLALAYDALSLAFDAQEDGSEDAARIETVMGPVSEVLSKVMLGRGADTDHLYDTKYAVREAHFGTAAPYGRDGPTVRRVLRFESEPVTEGDE